MKKYQVQYWNKDRSKPHYLFELSESGRWNGVGNYFWHDGIKIGQTKTKNRLLNGIYKENEIFRNFKKDKRQGIMINFTK